MSRSNPTSTNPATRFFKWSGSKGKLVYYDKEKQTEVEVKLPFTMLVLDELATITGFSEQDTSQYWSNEVRSVAREELTVRTSAGTKQVGLYKDLADVRSKGAKYAKSVYIAYKQGDEFVIGNFKAAGAALTAWIEFSNTCKVMNGTVVITGSAEAKKGATTYFTPTFEYKHSSPEEEAAAYELDKQLQVYLVQYFAEKNVDNDQEEILADSFEDEPKSGYDKFKESRPQTRKDTEEQEFATAMKKGLEADGINLDEIPF